MRIFVTDHQGQEHELEAVEGWRASDVIRDWGVGIRAECGGACACGTCHVYVDEAWRARLHEPSDEESDQLDNVFHVTPASRLCCPILLSETLDGLRLRLAPGSEA